MINQFLLAQSAGRSADELLDDCIKQLGSIPPEANFGFLYLSDHLADQAREASIDVLSGRRSMAGMGSGSGSGTTPKI